MDWCSAGLQAGMLCLWIYLGFMQGLVDLRPRVWLWSLQRRQRHSDFVLDPQSSGVELCAHVKPSPTRGISEGGISLCSLLLFGPLKH